MGQFLPQNDMVCMGQLQNSFKLSGSSSGGPSPAL